MSESPEFYPIPEGMQVYFQRLLREPDDVEWLLRTDALLALFTARRFTQIDAMRRAALADPARLGHGAPEVVERSVRMELAAGLRVTESRAAVLMSQADALVNRYPVVLEALACHRVTETHAVVLVEALDAVEPEFREELLKPALALAENLPVG